MANYIKVCPFIAEQLGVAGIRQKTADGNYILWEQDIMATEGETLEEKIQYLGGAQISSGQGKAELKGTVSPIPLLEASENDLPEEVSGETESNNEEETTKKRRKSK